MKENQHEQHVGNILCCFRQTIRIMRLSVFFMVVSTAIAWSATTYSQSTKLSVNLKDATVQEVIKTIEEQSEFLFLYQEGQVDLNRHISIRAEGKQLQEILDEVFKGTGNIYIVSDRQIVIGKAPRKALEAQLAAIQKDLKTTIEQSQQREIYGKVTDQSGEPLPGATVMVKGTTIGTVTDANGNFSLRIPSNAQTLQVSFVGMKTQEIALTGKVQIDVAMTEETIGLEEVIAIGYGTVKKSDLTGAISTLGGDQIAKRKTLKPTEALQGAIPGVNVIRTSGAPGEDPLIRIRGVTTIGTNTPLVIIDGVQGLLSTINPNDIESISVLKDAASASIYGSRAAAGVILVTTKRAKQGQTNLEYNFESGFDVPTRLPEYLSAVPYMKLINEKVWNDNNNLGTEYPTYSQELIENYPSLHAENPDKYPDTDWSTYLNEYAPRQRHLLTLTSGEKNIRSIASLSYDKMNALTDGRTYERITTRTNNDITISKNLAGHFDLYYLNTYAETENSGNPSASLLRMDPITTAFYSDGRVADVRNGESPWALLLKAGNNKSWTSLITGKLSLDFQPISGLRILGTVAPTFNFYKNKRFIRQTAMTSLEDPSLVTGYVRGGETTRLNENRNDNKSITTQFTVTYIKDIGEHNINVLAGYEDYYSFAENLGASRDKFTLNDYPYLNLGSPEYRNNSGNASEYASQSFFGRIMYNYKSKYLFQINSRYDGSSRFHKDYRWGLFPSVSAGWVLSEESFMKNFDEVSYLKLRASWGTLGNERIIKSDGSQDYYPYQSTVAFSNTLFYQGSDIVSNQTAYIPQYAIKDISWETTESYDFGMEINFFKDKLHLEGEYFRKTTRDMLLSLEIPDYIGLANPNQNTGKMHTNGWELTVQYRNKIGDFRYSLSGNIFDSKSVMGDLGGTEFLGDKVKFKGSEFNE